MLSYCLKFKKIQKVSYKDQKERIIYQIIEIYQRAGSKTASKYDW